MRLEQYPRLRREPRDALRQPNTMVEVLPKINIGVLKNQGGLDSFIMSTIKNKVGIKKQSGN